MNRTQREQRRRKRNLHQAKQAVKPYVKLSCAKRGIPYDGFEFRNGGREILIRGKDGNEYVSRLG